MKKSSGIFLLAAWLGLGISMLASNATASFIKGNGGNAVVCADHVEWLDLFEARVLEGFTFSAPDLETRALQRAKLHLKKADFEAVTRYFAEFDSERHWLVGSTLGIVKDSYHFAVPAGCTIEQTVLAREPLPGESRYLVRQDIFDRLPEWQQQALRWHEALYRRMLDRRLTAAADDFGDDPDLNFNSETVRRLVAALFAEETEAWTAMEWNERVSQFELGR